ncbi:Transcription factor bHLH121 [Vitis vinifera]|uniref:Transcription factor bHLH121 n=1 Tax=Vitis vinifera TaxID=29760 RepID=A0A438JGP5_VITVI|nr:Transcription factor bHLH121 [Vitis vinifera]
MDHLNPEAFCQSTHYPPPDPRVSSRAHTQTPARGLRGNSRILLLQGRPKNDKATILSDTIQLLKDLTAQVEKLKAENASLNEESRELTQEKNDLREEKASLKSATKNLNVQYQQSLRAMFPWSAIDPQLL